MNLDQFIAWASGQSLLWAPNPQREYLRGQCVQLVCHYVDKVWGHPVLWANAYDWFATAGNSSLWDRIPNDHNNPNQVPQRGDIIVWGPYLPGSGDATHNPAKGEGYGHIAIVLDARPGAATFISLDQNWGGKTVHQVTHNWSNVVGWIRPKGGKGGGPAPQQGGTPVIPDADNYYWRYGQKLAERLRGRQLSREEFRKYLVGQTDLRAIEILSDDPEADRTQQAQDVGVVALRDNWEGQINNLTASQSKLQQTVNEQNQTITDLRNTINDASISNADKQKALDEALEKLGVQNSELATLHDQLEQLKTGDAVLDQATQEPGGDSKFTKLLALILKLLPGKK